MKLQKKVLLPKCISWAAKLDNWIATVVTREELDGRITTTNVSLTEYDDAGPNHWYVSTDPEHVHAEYAKNIIMAAATIQEIIDDLDLK